MVDFSFRLWAKAVAVTELILHSLFLLCLLLVMGLSAAYGTEYVASGGKRQCFNCRVNVVFTVLCSLAILLTVVQLKLSFGLYKATAKNADVPKALFWSRFWRLYAVIMILLTIPGFFNNDRLQYTVVGFLIRLLFISMVHCFIMELEDAKKEISNKSWTPRVHEVEV